ncbi:alcohol dehydrogenase catalytic domain-containing protein [Oleomonas cavernae]|uniref:alcohol dehydrogenase catalytic domain-containing protein n=1 Tax=Oleomonas cavernae TaxID=2320859 RepID=UPI0018F5DB48|nr:alcohol dehydrogenase catalytic domain-containing protein [Oleomonas cavernae]
MTGGGYEGCALLWAEDIRCTAIDDAVLDVPHGILVETLATSICGSDLHIYRGALDPIMIRGRSQTGHELVGRVIEVGAAVTRFRKGDRVSMAYSCSCGDCHMCNLGQTAHCETTNKAVYGFGAAFGNLNGTHAEALVLPYAEGHASLVPEAISDRAATTLSCNLPTAVIANRLADIQPGETVAMIGAGPTGLLALDIALSRRPGCILVLDRVRHRLDHVRRLGVETIDVDDAGWKELALTVAGERGFDKIIEMVGLPESLQMSLDLVRAGGTVAALGVFCDNTFNLNLADVFLRDISLHMNGFANARPFMAEAMALIDRGIVDPDSLFSHEYRLDQIGQAFATFHSKRDNAFKMLIRP